MAPVSPSLIFSLCLIFILIPQAATQPSFICHTCSPGLGTYTTNSTYAANLKHVFSSFSSNTEIENGFYSASFGQDPDKVYAIGLCRGDLNQDFCRSCINDATLALIQLCPNQKEAIGWYDNCTLRFSNHSIYGSGDEIPSCFINQNNVSDVDGFGKAVKSLLDSMISEAASSNRKFATKTSVAPDLSKLYGFVQCTLDLSEQQCNNCLEMTSSQLPLFTIGMGGGRFYTPSCNFRFDTNLFFQPQADASLPPSPIFPSPMPIKENERNTARIAIIIAVPTVVAMILVISICIFLRARKPMDTCETVDEITSVESLQFEFSTIRAATDNFSDANKLGKGGFGAVYRGTLPKGQKIAVKRLARNSGQGDQEFKNEVLLVAKLQHRNLVRLLGFCLEGNERLLIYEFVPNTSLDRYIFDSMKCVDLNWERRYKIIGDFGMARMFVLDQSEGTTNRIVGTYGYMAPEYAMFGQFSVKSDIFSFGVLILEIVSGQKITRFCDEENIIYLLTYAWENWREGTTSNLIDPTLRSGPIAEMMRCIHIGLLCVQQNVADRPNMTSVLLMLNSNSVALPAPTQPASFLQSNLPSAESLQQGINSSVTKYEVSITELYPR
nr:cysteine-rich receptor-like protein kinase 29 [Quercus suber]